jgi:hypothetical protein
MDLLQTKPKAVKNARLLELDGEAVIHSMDNLKGYYLNSTATLIWKCCDGKHRIEDIEKEVLELFDGERIQVKADIEEMLLAFYKAQLLEN